MKIVFTWSSIVHLALGMCLQTRKRLGREKSKCDILIMCNVNISLHAAPVAVSTLNMREWSQLKWSQPDKRVGTGMRKCRIEDKDHLIGSDRKIQMRNE